MQPPHNARYIRPPHPRDRREVPRAASGRGCPRAALARDLYQHVDIGETIPERFFRTVAELLAYVYRLKNQSGTPASVRPSSNSLV